MATTSRESRRRKIVERGSDRLALISGRIPTIPLSSPPSQAHDESFEDSSQPQISSVQDLVDKTIVSPHEGDEGSVSVLQKQTPIGDTERTPVKEVSNKTQSFPVSSIDQTPSISNSGSQQVVETRTSQPNFFTPGRISAAIAASEQTRLYSSVAVAVLVVLSYIGFPVLGSTAIKSTVVFRPVMLLLLTNLTVVLARLLSENPSSRRPIRAETKHTPPNDDQDLAEQLGKALEIALVVKAAMDAVFMDFSVFAIIIICSLSVA